MNTDQFRKMFAAAVTPIVQSKPWFDELHMDKWLGNAPKKLEGRGGDEYLVCVYHLILEYLFFEGSAATEFPLEMRKAKDDTVTKPRYMAEVPHRQMTNHTAMRWHSRATMDKARTTTALDLDIATTLPRQWALLQPATRVNDEGRISSAAHISMDWNGALAPGIDGVRTLVVTILQWLHNVDGQHELEEWRRLTVDTIHVLHILTSQAGSMATGTQRDERRPLSPGLGKTTTKKSSRVITKSAKLRDS